MSEERKTVIFKGREEKPTPRIEQLILGWTRLGYDVKYEQIPATQYDGLKEIAEVLDELEKPKEPT